MNSFGRNFRISLWGESHGTQIGVCIDGVPAGIPLSESDFVGDLERRRSGGAGTTSRRESDVPHIVSGVFEGRTTGAPLTVIFENEDARASDYEKFSSHPRPSHADLVAAVTTDWCNDPRGGGHFSGRMTLALVAAGVVAKRLLPLHEIEAEFDTRIVAVGGSTDSEKFAGIIEKAATCGDSVGGVVECRVKGLPIGLGMPFFDSAESLIAHLLFAVPAVKGVEFGSGFEGVRLYGSERNDRIADAEGHTFTNNEGGVVGGLTNGNDLVVRVAVKPTASISREQMTFDFSKGEVAPLRIEGRHDACIALRAAVAVEAAVAIALADMAFSS